MVRVHQDPNFFLAHSEQSRNQIPFNVPCNLSAKNAWRCTNGATKILSPTNQNIKKVGLWHQKRWDRKGILKAHRSITQRRYYTYDQYLQIIGQKAKKRQVVTYCRVSSASQKKDLISQKNAVESFCFAAGKT